MQFRVRVGLKRDHGAWIPAITVCLIDDFYGAETIPAPFYFSLAHQGSLHNLIGDLRLPPDHHPLQSGFKGPGLKLGFIND